jgi:hypothetical protein
VPANIYIDQRLIWVWHGGTERSHNRAEFAVNVVQAKRQTLRSLPRRLNIPAAR